MDERPGYSQAIRAFFPRIGGFTSHTAHAAKIVVRNAGIPRPLRWLAAVGLLPVPGPLDEAALLLVALILLLFYRPQLRQAWYQARPRPRQPPA